MYRTCIFCSKDLGSNEVIEHFPVGSRIAFDAARGRLWAVCVRCGRWNLAPIEERWEAVEEAERRFRDSRLRVQSGNIGMCAMPDGARLIRIGEALTGEVAAWRYGREFMRRRTRMYMGSALGAAGLGAIWMGAPLIATTGVALPLLGAWRVAGLANEFIKGRRPLLHLEASQSPTLQALTIRQRHLPKALLTRTAGELAVVLPRAVTTSALTRVGIGPADLPRPDDEPLVRITGEDARRLLSRGMVKINASGASRKSVARALTILEVAGSADSYLRDVSSRDIPLKTMQASTGVFADGRSRFDFTRPVDRMKPISYSQYSERIRAHPTIIEEAQVLAVEMALHEESERRALEGELAQLEDAWRDAEEIAMIADALPDDV